ncbi:MAG TPA: DNA-binding response regulator [Oribacterium sp.]|nr:DNA-binding response regulator [Oribacterium sp.]
MNKVLMVDDEQAIRLAVRMALRREGMEVTEAADGAEALELLRREKFQLVILDVMMEHVGGYEVLQTMRANGDHTPVMMLSGKSDEMDQVLGLGFGADSYLTKPFHTAVLIQTAKALLRRSQVYSQESNDANLRRGPFMFDLLKLECLKDGKPLNFTAREQALFRFLMEHPGQVFTKEQLYTQVWNEAVVDDNTITVYVKRIRNKIEEDPKAPKYLKTVRGIGYVLSVEE